MIDTNREIQELEQGKTYKYLGTEESEGIQYQQMKERLKQEYSRRLRMILKSELNARNKKDYSNWSTSGPSIEVQFWYN